MENLFFDKNDLKKCGTNVIIGKTVRIRYPHLVEIGDNVIIDDFTYISTSLKIHSYVHISSGCKLIGGPESYVEMQNFSTLSPNVVLSAGSDDYLSGIATPLVDKKYKANSEIGNIILKEHTIVGSNSTVLPNVTFNTGATVGANSLIKEDLDEWSLNVGIPSRKIKDRKKEEIIKAEKEFFKETSSQNSIMHNNSKSKITLATQGSQGILALRELFNLGYKKENIDVYVCESKFNTPLIEFLKYLEKDFVNINNANTFDDVAKENNKAKILLSVSWKYLISDKVLQSFNYRAINFHPGLLPEYKGCFSSSWSLINNEKYVGFTYHFMNKDFDSGNIILKSSIKIEDDDDAFSLNYKIFQQGIPKLGNVLKQIESKGKKQKNKGKYYPNKLPHGGQLQIDWDKDFAERFIRAINFPPHPPAYVCVDGDNVNVQNVNDFMRLKNE